MTDPPTPHSLSQPMTDACTRGDRDAVRALLASGEPIDAESDEEETALTFAIVWSRCDVVEFLLASGADPEAPHASSWSPLMCAAHGGSLRSVELLLASGADVSRTDRSGRNAESLGAKFPEIVALLTRSGR